MDTSGIIQSKEIHMTDNYSNWSNPQTAIDTLYQIGSFDFKTARSIKIHEETVSVNEEFHSYSLLSNVSIRKYLEKGYRYIHFGLIQVAIKPLVHIGVDAPVYLALRDNRLKRYKTSLLAIIQTNICNGPIYFNQY